MEQSDLLRYVVNWAATLGLNEIWHAILLRAGRR